jgi:hypothetical protein
MKATRLGQIMESLGLAAPKSLTRSARAKRILAEYGRLDLEMAKVMEKCADDLWPVNPKFEAKLSVESPVDAAVGETRAGDAVKAPGLGGARPGAGRPKGSTAEICMMKQLSEQPHPAIKKALEMLFQSWALATGCDNVALTDDEAILIGLRWTNGLELIGLAQRIPVWLTHVIELVWDTLNIVKLKARLARESRDAKAVTATAAAVAAVMEPPGGIK